MSLHLSIDADRFRALYVAPKPSAPAQPQRFDDGFEIPPDVDVPPELRGEGVDDVTMGAGGSGGADDGGACPHCTFVNEPGATDCDVCGLPLR